MDWLLDGNTFEECRRSQCPKVLPCTMAGCGRPRPDAWANNILALYQECAERRALPYSGGILEQPADLMQWFRAIDARRAAYKAKIQEREHTEMELAKRRQLG